MFTLQGGKQHGVFASTGQISHCLNAGGIGRIDYETETLVTQMTPWMYQGMRIQSPDEVADTVTTNPNGGTRINPVLAPLAVCFDTTQVTSKANYSSPQPGDPCHQLASAAHPPAVALAIRGRDGTPQIEMGDEVANAILTPNGGRGGIGVGAVMSGMAVRRLTPVECARLQGFPDDHCAITINGKPAADGPIYKAYGNSMAVPVIAWIGRRIIAALSTDSSDPAASRP